MAEPTVSRAKPPTTGPGGCTPREAAVDPATTPRSADYLADCLEACLGYGRMLAEDIPADRFVCQPLPALNHPAFILGHITLVTSHALEVLGRPDLARISDGYRELFEAGCTCEAREERYPPKDQIIAFYEKRHREAAAVIRETSEEALRQENPGSGEKRVRFPTVGALANFVVNCHHIAHLGQLSAWRRAMGMAGVLRP
ncbi:MAG: DinB family protein [Phycisphaerales bacterium]|nr:MAG: DinB family protein [Phycisphaerales bacterium]